VEVPCFVDRLGIHPARVGDLPPQCAALNQSNVTVQALAVEAGLTGNPEYAMQAVAMDPLTSAVCTLREAREMTAAMLKAEARWLPQFQGKRLRPAPSIRVSAKTPHAPVPLDPALAIVHRFGELAARKLKRGRQRG
jgi:alpha-galactosidase